MVSKVKILGENDFEILGELANDLVHLPLPNVAPELLDSGVDKVDIGEILTSHEVTLDLENSEEVNKV